MSKKKKIVQRPAVKPVNKVNNEVVAPTVKSTTAFHIARPQLWLTLVAFALYIPSFFLGFTELDDTIFIRDFAAYNEDLHNLIVSFQRGLFDVVKDPYYRPLFMDSMILNYHLSPDVMAFHIINVLLHVSVVLLLYRLFRKLNISELYAFILTLVFAVHPVLSQAVAWIPGRNDTMLALFILPFFIHTIDYSLHGKARSIILSTLFLLLAFFTKETAVFAAPAAFVLIIFVLNQNWRDKKNIIQYGIWTCCFLLWYLVRAAATVQPSNMTIGYMLSDFAHRIPLIWQYLGKIFLPFNLSVFPIQEDTVNYYGFIAIALLIVIILLNPQRNLRIVLSGSGIFLLFLLPVLLVPNTLNEEAFEHRLYLPIIGILMVLPQTVLFKNKLTEKKLFIVWAVVCGGLAIINLAHQRKFADAHAFWAAAAESSPHSAYADMMLGARESDVNESNALFRKAYLLNPKQKYLNFYYGVMLQKEDSVQQSEKYLLAEKNISDYYECDFYLARVAAERKDFPLAIRYLENNIKRDPNNKMAHNNLLLLYLQTQQTQKAINEVKMMRQLGIDIPQQISRQLGV